MCEFKSIESENKNSIAQEEIEHLKTKVKKVEIRTENAESKREARRQ